MASIAFLGLGQMGTIMAARLVGAGHKLTVWNRTPERTRSLAEKGAAVATSPAQAASGVDYAITMLATPEALEEVVFGKSGLIQGLQPGQILIDMSTIGVVAFHSVAERMPPGVTLVDAPVRGSLPQAEQGRLEIYVGASAADFSRLQPILEPLGSVRHTGGPGSGAAVKLVVNLALGAAITALGEALSLGKGLSLPREMLLDILADTPIGGIVKVKGVNIQSNNFEPNFKLRLAAKDLRLAIEAASNTGRDLRLTRSARDWLDEAVERGAGDLDFSAVVTTILNEESF